MMKKLLVVFMFLTIGIFVASQAGAINFPYIGSDPSTAGQGINGTVHDISAGPASNMGGAYPGVSVYDGTDDYLNRICIYCHAPHHTYRLTAQVEGSGPIDASGRFTYLPLWNHAFTLRPDYVPYSNGAGPSTGDKAAQSMAANGPAFQSIGSVSLLCLSCHDGSQAVNTYGNPPQDSRSQSTGAATIAAQYQIGVSTNPGDNGVLQNHHPIGFDYDTVQAADAEIESADVAVFNGTPVRDLLYSGRMECSTCHAVHNTGNTGEKLLYISDQNSNLCLTCHLKGYIQ